MKIGIYAAEPHPGGEVNYIKTLVRALTPIPGMDVTLYVTPESFKHFGNNSELISIKNTRNFNFRFRATLKDKLRGNLSKFFLFLIGTENPISVIKMDYKNIDLLIFPYWALEAAVINTAYIIIPHDKRAFEHGNYFVHKLNKKIFRRASVIVAESNLVKNDIVQYSSVNDQKIKILVSPPECGIEAGQESTKNVICRYKLPQKFLFYPSHINSLKNHANLILAFAKIRDHYGCNVNLVCTYPSRSLPYFSRIIDMMTNLRIDSIVFLENIPYGDLIAIYKLATALVMPTLLESVSMPIWEAFYLGVPVVSSNVCALPEQVGGAGLIFDPNNIDDIAEKIYTIWTNESLRKELIQKGYERVKDLTLENYSKQWEEVITMAYQDSYGI